MASKPSHSKETMVTRFKSAQQRRLRPMDRSMTAMTKLLKCPERKRKGKADSTKKSPKSGLIKGQKQSPRSGSIKAGPANPKSDSKVTSLVEYYPNKLKRHVLPKKIVLKPNNNLKILGKTNRRKFGTPHKGSTTILDVDPATWSNRLTDAERIYLVNRGSSDPLYEFEFSRDINGRRFTSRYYKRKLNNGEDIYINTQHAAKITNICLLDNLFSVSTEITNAMIAVDSKVDRQSSHWTGLLTGMGTVLLVLLILGGIRSPISSPNQPSEPSNPEMSINEVIRGFDETHELDDDDLMEILTCPSPVWWEDPPDPTYIEDPVGKRILPDMESEIKENSAQSKPAIDVPKTNLDINLKDKDINFKSKRSKLEGLLSNLKGKFDIEKNNVNNKGFDRSRHKEAPVVSSDEINQTKQIDGERKSSHNSLLPTKENRSKIIKIANRNKISVTKKNKKLKRNSKTIIQNIISFFGNIKIKNPDEINRDLQETLNNKNNDSTDIEKDGQVKDSEIGQNLQNINEKEQHNVIDFQDKKEAREEVNKSETKDKDDNVLSDNTDISEISINEEVLCDLENINIPIGGSSLPKDKDLKNTTTNDGSKHIDKVETCQVIAEIKTSQKQRNDESGEERNKSEFKVYNDNTDSKVPLNEQDTMAMSSSTAEFEVNPENNTLINLFDEEPSYDSHEFDMQFENAILGLENTVLRPGKVKKRTKLCTKPDTNKDVKLKEEIKIEVNDKMSLACTNKREAVSSTKVTGKRKHTSSIDEGKNISIKTDTLDCSDMKVKKVEDVSQRGRVRRRKAHFDYKSDISKTLNVKKEVSNDPNLKCTQVFKKPTENKPEKIKKRKKAKISGEDTKNALGIKTEVQEPSTEITEIKENADDVSKRGRIRRKKVPFSVDKGYNDFKTVSHSKPKRKYQKHKTLKTKSQIIIAQKKYYNKKKPNSPNEAYLQTNKKCKTEEAEHTDIVNCVLNDLKTKLEFTKHKNSTLHLTNHISNIPENSTNINNKNKDAETLALRGFNMVVDNVTSTGSLYHSDTSTRTFKVKEPADDKTQTFLSVFKKYGINQSANEIDSISDSGVTFIDECNVDTSKTKKIEKIRSKSATYVSKRLESQKINTEATHNMKEINDITNKSGLNVVPNLGPNYKSMSPRQQKNLSSKKRNEQIFLNTDSNKLVTVQSGKELFDNSVDFETITVFKIIPKEIEKQNHDTIVIGD